MSTGPRYMIRSDIEGVSGVVAYAQAEPGAPEYAFGQRMFRADLCACIDGLQAGGAAEIVVYDEHCAGRNIDPAWLPDGVTFIAGKPPYRADWAGGLDASFDGLVLLGFHAKADTPGGLLAHSYEQEIAELVLGGQSVGEIGMETAIAGDWGVPLVLVTADSAGCREAEALVPGAACVAVKDALGPGGARCHPLETTRRRIHDAARTVACAPPPTAPWRCGPGVELVVRLRPGPYADAVRRAYAADCNGDGALVIRAETATGAWADYWARKLHCQQLAAEENA